MRATTGAARARRWSWIAAAAALSALALAPALVRADPWTRTDTAWEAAALAVTVADWRQTAYIARHGSQYFERNPILGDRPGRAQLNFYFASTMTAHLLAARLLPTAYRRTLQLLTIGFEGGVVANNARVGIALDF